MDGITGLGTYEALEDRLGVPEAFVGVAEALLMGVPGALMVGVPGALLMGVPGALLMGVPGALVGLEGALVGTGVTGISPVEIMSLDKQIVSK